MKKTRRQFLIQGSAAAALTACGGIEPPNVRRTDTSLNVISDTGLVPTGHTGVSTTPTTALTTTPTDPLAGYNPDWQDIGNALEVDKVAGVDYFTEQQPGPWADKIPVHLPQISISGRTCTITLPDHPQDLDHYESLIYVRSSSRMVIGLIELTGGANAGPATYSFELAPNITGVTAYAYCNLHGLWKSDLYLL